MVGIVIRQATHGQHFTGLRIQYHCTACFGFELRQSSLQLFACQTLHIVIQRQGNRFAGFGHHIFRRIHQFDHVAVTVAQHDLFAIFAGQCFILAQFQAFQALPFAVGKSDNVRKKIACRIAALGALFKMQRGNAQCFQFIGIFQ